MSSSETTPTPTDQEENAIPTIILENNPHAGFDPHAGVSWLYPIDYTTPDYLPMIAEKALYYNSLIILPNKFEKTFLTTVSMYNVYCWYPLGKIIFMATKRSLITEQMTACETLMKFQRNDIADMVMKPLDRLRHWMSKRIIFTSSHKLLGDMNRVTENIPLDNVKLIVIDEPQLESRLHTKILQKVYECNKHFRVLCVTTTSSKTIDAGSLKQWLISSIELQWGNPLETPEDWLMNKKEISNIVTPIGPSLTALLDELRDIGQQYINILQNSKLICKTEFVSTDVEMLRRQRSKYETAILTGVVRKNHHDLILNFHLAERTLVGYSILKQDGIIAFLEYFYRDIDIFVQSDSKLVEFLNKLRLGVYNMPHPKFRTLENFLREFFQRRAHAKVLVVAERLDSAMIICENLERVSSCKRKMLVDGNYLQDIELYRKGELDVLIVTTAMEPIINLGDTDLIVLFNITDNPREFLAHIARTRGASPGAIVILTTEGSEQLAVDEVLNTRRMYFFENRNILPIGVDLSNMMMQSSPALIPPGFQPQKSPVYFHLKSDNRVTEHALLSGQPQVGEKRKIVQVLSEKPPSYDLINGQMHYEVVPLKQRAVTSPGTLLLNEEPCVMPCKSE